MNDVLHDPDVVERVVVSLLASATGGELPKILSAAVRAGMMWSCPRPCGQANYPTRTTCIECRTPREGADQ